MSETQALHIHEIYLSLQGESTWAGWPCIFIRLTGCDLRCSYCDTAYAFRGGTLMSLGSVQSEVDRLAAPYRQAGPASHPALPLVELTGGEPLLQRPVLPLMDHLAEAGFTVLLETSGAHDIAPVKPPVRRIIDVKCPSSGEAGRNRWENLQHVRPGDEFKFVIGTVDDYEWAKAEIEARQLAERCPVLLSWAHPLASSQRDPSLKPLPAEAVWLSRQALAERILADALPVRFQVQLHKVIWPPEQKGV